jgi:hypothetical protein
MLSLCGFRSSITTHRRSGTSGKEQLCILFSHPATSDVVRSSSIHQGPVTRVWCPTTELVSVVVRRNGKVFLAGNSSNDWATTYIVDAGFDHFLPSMLVLDFDEGNLMATNFTLRNPNAKSACGCGTSFGV